MGHLEEEIGRIMRYQLSSLTSLQNAFRAGRSRPKADDLTSDNAEDAILEGLEISNAAITGLHEAVLRIARELDDRSSA